MSTQTQQRLEIISSDQFQASVVGESRLDQTVNRGQRADKDYLARMVVKYAARRMLPYGRWTTSDGREIIFNREYQPMYGRGGPAGDKSVFYDRQYFVPNIIKVEYFYGDHNTPVDYLLRKFSNQSLDADQSKACRRSLVICLAMMVEYEPKQTEVTKTTWRTFARSIGL